MIQREYYKPTLPLVASAELYDEHTRGNTSICHCGENLIRFSPRLPF